MIIESIFSLILLFLKLVFNLLPNIPPFPDTLMNSINIVFDTIFNHLDLLGLFFRIDTIKILVPLIIIVVNFEYIYHFTIWILKKLPFSID